MHRLIFGTALDETVSWIVGEALKANTSEAYQRAYDEIHGIDKLWITITCNMRNASRPMGNRSGGEFASIALSNTLRQMCELRDRPEMRAAFALMVLKHKAATV